MNLGRRRQDHFEINIIPFIDILLVIIIFFTVSTTFERYARININLPKANQERSDTELVRIDVDIDARGNVYVGGKPLLNTQVLTIREALRDAMHDLKEPSLVISADAETTHQSVVRVMDAARQIGLVRITFVTERTEESPPAP